jgi:hypothetical protein
MISYHYPKNNISYSPNGIGELYNEAIKNENGNIEAVTKKGKYQRLRELRYASFLALAIKKSSSQQFFLSEPNSHSPDVLFLDLIKNEAFGVEVMDLFNYKKPTFDGNYTTLAQDIWDRKGRKDLKMDHLLVVNRINEASFNVTKLVNEIQKFNWQNVERIWFAIYTGSNLNWTFFEIYALGHFDDKASISFSPKSKEDMKFWY